MCCNGINSELRKNINKIVGYWCDKINQKLEKNILFSKFTEKEIKISLRSRKSECFKRACSFLAFRVIFIWKKRIYNQRISCGNLKKSRNKFKWNNTKKRLETADVIYCMNNSILRKYILKKCVNLCFQIRKKCLNNKKFLKIKESTLFCLFFFAGLFYMVFLFLFGSAKILKKMFLSTLPRK